MTDREDQLARALCVAFPMLFSLARSTDFVAQFHTLTIEFFQLRRHALIPIEVLNTPD